MRKGGRVMINRLRRLLPHAAILICNMYIVFFLIDRVNTAMNFIDNRLTKGLLLALCVISWFNCRTLLRLANRPERPAPRPQSPYTQARRPSSGTRQPNRGGYDAPRYRGEYEPRYSSPVYRSDGSGRASSASGYGDRRTPAGSGYGERRISSGSGDRRTSSSNTRYGEERYR